MYTVMANATSGASISYLATTRVYVMIVYWVSANGPVLDRLRTLNALLIRVLRQSALLVRGSHQKHKFRFIGLHLSH